MRFIIFFFILVYLIKFIKKGLSFLFRRSNSNKDNLNNNSHTVTKNIIDAEYEDID
tara:strand:+ start:1528 stop:1695 length:168 start_codon:yes stop_codon:yes gene_type:complete